MASLRAAPRAGLDYLAEVTTLLQRARSAHPTAGLFEAADLQWWWRTARSTDALPQLFWFDASGRPEAALIATDWGDWVALDPLLRPGATPEWYGEVFARGLDHVADRGYGVIRLEVDRDDGAVHDVLAGHGFVIEEDAIVETWMVADRRPPVSQLPDGYRLSTRGETMDRPHHIISAARRTGDPEPRLRQTSLYRADLDLVVHDERGDVAAYGLFWYDPVTATGLVEPMRTEDAHQRRGLARHVLTSGVDLLARAGAQRIKICFEPGNPASKHLYLSVGFEPVRETIAMARRAA